MIQSNNQRSGFIANLRGGATRTWQALQLGFGWVPLSYRGAIALVILLWVRHKYGIQQQDRILWIVSSGGLLFIGILSALVLTAAIWLRMRPENGSDKPLEFCAGVKYRTAYVVQWLGWVPLLSIDIAWETPPRVAARLIPRSAHLVEQVVAHERALSNRVARRLTVSDIFGLGKVTVRRKMLQEVVIKPNRGKTPLVQPFEQYRGGDLLAHPKGHLEGDLIEMRKYSAGDPLKLLLWKHFARSGRLLVRTPERAVSPCDRALAAFVASEGDEATAGIACALLENGVLGHEFRFCADGEKTPTESVSEAVAQIVRCSNAREHCGTGLERLLHEMEAHCMESYLLFVPAKPTPWLDKVVAQLKRSRVTANVIIGVDGIERNGHEGGLARLLFRQHCADEDIRSIEDVQKIGQQFAEIGADVRVIRRDTGQAVSLEELAVLCRDDSHDNQERNYADVEATSIG